MLRRSLSARVLIIAMGICIPGLGQAATLEVGPGQTYATIQTAIDAAAPLDLVLVHDGTYVENVVISKTLFLRARDYVVGGENDGAIIDASGSETDPGILVTADGVWVDGFTVVGSLGIDLTGNSRSGIHLRGVSGCTVSHNNLGWDEEGFRNSVGLFLEECDHCDNTGNEIYDSLDGFALANGTFNTFSGNHCEGAVYNTHASGITLYGSLTGVGYESTTQHNVFTGNELVNNYVGIELNGHCSYNQIQGNTITGNQIGVTVSYSYFNQISGNTISDNAARGIWQNATYYSTIWANVIDSNANGIWLGYLSISDYGSSYNNIFGNTITNSSYAGLRISNKGIDNRMSLNHFANNFMNVVSYGTDWNTATPVSYFFGENWNGQLGNYYDTYTGSDLDGDGVGDTDLPFNDGDPAAGPSENFPLVSSPVEFDIMAWYLGGGDPQTMFDDNEFPPVGSQEIPGFGSVVWISDQTTIWAANFANAVWTGQITFDNPPYFDVITVEVGSSSDGLDFTPSGAQASVGTDQQDTFTTTAAAVLVPDDHHLALRLTNTTEFPYLIRTGGLYCYVSSPGLDDPHWPIGSGGSPVPDLDESRFWLGASYPNPFNPATTITFALPAPAIVSLGIFDVSGRFVQTLLTGEMLEQGVHERVWNGTDSRGRLMPSGAYFYRLDAGEYQETRRMALIK